MIRLHLTGRVVVAAVLAIAAALLLDRWAYATLRWPEIYQHDYGRLLRVMGFWPTWTVVAAAVWLAERRRAPRPGPRLSRALLLALAPALGGLGAELFKMLIRRERPGLTGGAYVFRSWSQHFFSTADLGLPSGHAMVAFAGAALAARAFPGSGPVWYLLAAGCALTRVLDGAHFLSDVVLGAVAGIGIAAALWRWGQGPPS